MKLIKNLFVFLIFITIAALVLSLMTPEKQTVERSIRINAKPEEVYRQMMFLQHFSTWSVWGKADSSIKYKTDGKDGAVGAKVSWEGSPLITGKGEITLTKLQQDKLISHDVYLLEPQPLKAHSTFLLTPVGNQTEVKWTFEVPTKRPLNILNIFYNLEKERGTDFAAGLAALKLMIEKTPLAKPAAFNVQPSEFPYTKYVAIRQTVLWADLPAFFQQHFGHLSRYVLKDSPALQTCLIFETDEKLYQSKVAAAFPVPVGHQPVLNAPEEMIEVPASRSVEVVFEGAENIKQQVYQALNDYIALHKLNVKKPVIEQYLSGDSMLRTRIIYLVD